MVVCSLLLLGKNVGAGNPGDFIDEGTVILGILIGGAFEISTIVFAVGNLKDAIEEERPSLVWRLGGYITGGVHAAAGIGYGIYLVCVDKSEGIPIALIPTAIGALGIGFTIWADSQPERPEQKLALAPMIMQDVRGRPAFGVGLRLVDW